MDIGSNVETSQRESLRTLRSRKVSSAHSEVGTRHQGELAGIQVTAGRGCGRRGGNTDGVVPPTPPGSLAPDKIVVQGCGRMCSTARSGYPRSGHVRAG